MSISSVIVPLLVSLLAWSGTGDTGTLVRAAEAVLAEQYPSDAHRLEVRLLRKGGAVEDVAHPEVVFTADRELPRGHTKVDVWSGGTKAGWALLYVAHFDSVLVAQTTFRKDDMVALADLDLAWMETTKFRGEPMRLSDYETLLAQGGVFAARALRADKALRHGDLRPPYAAETGTSVTLHYERGAMRFKVIGKARKPGFVGDVIKVYSPDTGVTYRVRLTAPQTAEWIETL